MSKLIAVGVGRIAVRAIHKKRLTGKINKTVVARATRSLHDEPSALTKLDPVLCDVKLLKVLGFPDEVLNVSHAPPAKPEA